jgi:hypothetical protein
VVLVNIIPVMSWKVILNVLSSMKRKLLVAFSPERTWYLEGLLRCEPVCLVPSVILVKCLFSYLCIVVAVYPAGNPER